MRLRDWLRALVARWRAPQPTPLPTPLSASWRARWLYDSGKEGR